jgi:hypothetical protein
VRIVTDLDRLPRQVGVRHLPQVRVPGADEAELARRVAAVLGIKVPAADRPALMRTLRRRMPGSGAAPVVVPLRERPWVSRSAERMVRELTRAGYPVVGDLADLAPRPWSGGPVGATDEQVLDLAVRMVADPGWRTGEARDEVQERMGQR